MLQILVSCSNEEVHIESIEFVGDKVPVEPQDETNSLTLLKVAVPYSIADAIVDLDFQPPHMANDIKAFGLQGKTAIYNHSKEFLTPQLLLGKPAYKLSDPFRVDLNKRMVTLGFECLIEGFEGIGTDYVYFNDQNKIFDLVAVRHSGSYNPVVGH